MVGDGGSLYTIEGLAAGLLMIATAAIVLQSVSVYTPGDTHIDDMLLEQLGADALAVLDMPVEPGGETELEQLLYSWDAAGFHNAFYPLLRERSFAPDDPVQYAASISYRFAADDSVNQLPFTESASYTGYDPAIRVTRWVHLDSGHTLPPPVPSREQMVLLEVILWRG
ncbi:DUF7288 family protein [Methanocalculus sp. MC3]